MDVFPNIQNLSYFFVGVAIFPLYEQENRGSIASASQEGLNVAGIAHVLL